MNPHLDMALDFIEHNRFLMYLALFGLFQLYELFKWYMDQKIQSLEMEVLSASFQVEESMQNLSSLAAAIDPDDNEEKVEINLSSSDSERMRLLMDRYIRERQSIYSEQLDAKILAEQESEENEENEQGESKQ